MFKAMSVAMEKIESLIDVIGRATLWVALVMISLVAVNVILRYTLSFGSVWSQELEWHLLAALILLGMSYALQRGDNVRVDLFYANYQPKTKFIVDVASAVLTILVALIFLKLSIAYVGQSFATGEISNDPGGIPYRWVVKSLIPIGYGLLTLQACAELMRRIHTWKTSQGAAHV